MSPCRVGAAGWGMTRRGRCVSAGCDTRDGSEGVECGEHDRVTTVGEEGFLEDVLDCFGGLESVSALEEDLLLLDQLRHATGFDAAVVRDLYEPVSDVPVTAGQFEHGERGGEFALQIALSLEKAVCLCVVQTQLESNAVCQEMVVEI